MFRNRYDLANEFHLLLLGFGIEPGSLNYEVGFLNLGYNLIFNLLKISNF